MPPSLFGHPLAEALAELLTAQHAYKRDRHGRNAFMGSSAYLEYSSGKTKLVRASDKVATLLRDLKLLSIRSQPDSPEFPITDSTLMHIFAGYAMGCAFMPGIGKRRTGATWDEWEWYGSIGIHDNGIARFPLTSDSDAVWLMLNLCLTVSNASGISVAHADYKYTFAPTSLIMPSDALFRYAVLNAAAAIGYDKLRKFLVNPTDIK